MQAWGLGACRLPRLFGRLGALVRLRFPPAAAAGDGGYVLLQAIEAEETVLQLRGSLGEGGSFEQDLEIWLRC